jgi:hypothetical protein
MGAWGALSRRLHHLTELEPEDEAPGPSKSGGAGPRPSSSSSSSSSGGAGSLPAARHRAQHQPPGAHHHHPHHGRGSHRPAPRRRSGGGGGGDGGGGLVLEALKLALRASAAQPPRRDGRAPAERALGLAAALADLAAAGAPLDAPCIAAGVVADAVGLRLLHIRSVEAKLGPEVAGLVHDMLAVRRAPERVELYDDEAARCGAAGRLEGWGEGFEGAREAA